MISVAKVFTNGRSQAIRLPKEFRFNTKEVILRKEKGKVVIEPKPEPESSWDDFFADTPKFPEFELERKDNTPPQDRELF